MPQSSRACLPRLSTDDEARELEIEGMRIKQALHILRNCSVDVVRASPPSATWLAGTENATNHTSPFQTATQANQQVLAKHDAAVQFLLRW